MKSVKHQFHRLLRRYGLDIVRLENTTMEYQAVVDTIRASGASIVLDVGANAGQFGDLVLDTGFRGHLISFEAIEEVHRELVRHAKKRSSTWAVAPCLALGSERGHAELNVSGNSVSSSLLPMRREHVVALPTSTYVSTEQVRVERLDDVAPQLMPDQGMVFLKIDTQGFELEVLKGAKGILPRIVAIQIEMSLVPLYEGAPVFLDALSYMESLGFELFSLVCGFKNKETGRLLQVDGVFLRRDPGGTV